MYADQYKPLVSVWTCPPQSAAAEGMLLGFAAQAFAGCNLSVPGDLGRAGLSGSGHRSRHAGELS
jgi:hypothetical protein